MSSPDPRRDGDPNPPTDAANGSRGVEPSVRVRPIDGLEMVQPGSSVEDAIFREIVRLRDAGEAAALATVIEVKGSAPGREPMKILVRSDGSTLGTVGGGCLEEEVKRRARQVIEEERPARVSMTLTETDTPGGALICGGTIDVFLEPITAPPLLIFGGGHVSRAVAHVAARTGFRIVVTDDRPEYASRERFPMAAQTIVEFPDVAAQTIPIERATFVLVMTRTHADDRRILHELWKRNVQPRYLGMIGSGTKARLTFEELAAAGVGRDWLRRVRTPVGLRIGARTSDEIAVSVVAEMIAVRRGKNEGRWNVREASPEMPA